MNVKFCTEWRRKDFEGEGGGGGSGEGMNVGWVRQRIDCPDAS